jgi:hypothetical protein
MNTGTMVQYCVTHNDLSITSLTEDKAPLFVQQMEYTNLYSYKNVTFVCVTIDGVWICECIY